MRKKRNGANCYVALTPKLMLNRTTQNAGTCISHRNAAATGLWRDGRSEQWGGMFLLRQGDFEGWVVVGPGPGPGIWVTMETGPRVTTNTGWNFSIRSQATEEWESSGKFLCLFLSRSRGRHRREPQCSKYTAPCAVPQLSPRKPGSLRSSISTLFFPFVYNPPHSTKDSVGWKPLLRGLGAQPHPCLHSSMIPYLEDSHPLWGFIWVHPLHVSPKQPGGQDGQIPTSQMEKQNSESQDLPETEGFSGPAPAHLPCTMLLYL